jgi:soluble lytic murein transglycosylase-like protein
VYSALKINAERVNNMPYDVETLINENVDRYTPKLTDYPDINFYALLKAEFKVESNFNQSAIMNEVNVGDFSIGLGQIRIDTARGLYDFGSKTRDEIKALLLDGRFNAFLTGKYLVYQLKRYSGNIKLAVSAYNGGSAMFRIDGKLIYYDEKGFFQVIDNARHNVIGYDEDKINTYEIWNKDYVNAVMKYYDEYSGKKKT